MAKKITIKHIADLAGVSRGTVDRVLNNRTHVRPDIYEKVMKVVKETGYLSPKEAHLQNVKQHIASPVLLGVVMPNWTGHFITEIENGIRAATEELTSDRVKVIIEKCQTDTPDEVIEKIDTLLSAGIKGLAICAMNDNVIVDKMISLSQIGMPVITYNSDLPKDCRLAFIGQDYHKSGRIAAELLSKCISPQSDVLATIGSLSFDGHRTRLNGFLERIVEVGFTTDKILTIETLNDYQITYRNISNALKANPRLSAIYMANRSVAACTKAVEDAGKRHSIRIICHDISNHTKALLRENKIDFSISQDLFQQGYQPLFCLCEYLSKGRLPEHIIKNNNIQIFCSQNL